MRAVRNEELDRLEAQFQEPVYAVCHAIGCVGVAGVAENLVFLRAAEQFIDGLAEQLALEVPEGVVHGTDGVACQADVAVCAGGTLHHVPGFFCRHAVLADKDGCELVVDDAVDGRAVDGDAKSPCAVLGGYDAGCASPRGAEVGFAELCVHHRGAYPIGHFKLWHPGRSFGAGSQINGDGLD